MPETAAAPVFWTCALLIAHAYLGYPVLVYVLGRLYGRPTIRKEIWPRVSVLVPAYNERHVISAKIQNCMQLEYPRDRLEVLVASDGSTDGTSEVIARTPAGPLRGVVFPERRGKAAVINDLVEMASGEILVMSDASSMLEPGSLRALVSNFADPRVGCVSGIYRIAGDGDSRGGPEALYWRYETFIRRSESRLGSMLGAHGSLFGIRRELFEPLAVGIRNEDFIIPVTILLRGYRSIYDTRAVAWEDAQEMTGFARRISLAAGNYQQMVLLMKRRGWLRKPLVLFQFVSHKMLRLFTPFLIMGMYASNAWLLDSWGYTVAFAAQTVFFVVAALGRNANVRRGRALVAAPYYFCLANVAGVVALQRIVRQRALVGQKTLLLTSQRK